MVVCRWLVGLAVLLLSFTALADDVIDRLQREGAIPPALVLPRGHSDATEPVGRMLDLLAAGSYDEARRLRPAACARWRATRAESPFSGKVVIWATVIEMDALCEEGSR
jgi:hypothetical protein